MRLLQTETDLTMLDYSDLRIKQNVSIEVVDRYGAPYTDHLIKITDGTAKLTEDPYQQEHTGIC
jgi:hypothetical protein